MRGQLAWLATALIGFGVGACGSAGNGTGSTSGISSAAATGTRIAAAGTGADAAHGTTRYRNDGDNDPSNDGDPDDFGRKQIEDDHDGSEDNLQPQNDRYHDRDDASLVTFGAPASAAVEKAAKALVKRYYAAGAASNGVKGCGMIVPRIANSIAENYGRAPGPAYLRGAHSCGAVLFRLFRREHARYAGPFTVTAVRVRGDEAFAFLGSSTTPAGYVTLSRENGKWMIGGLLGGPLS